MQPKIVQNNSSCKTQYYWIKEAGFSISFKVGGPLRALRPELSTELVLKLSTYGICDTESVLHLKEKGSRPLQKRRINHD